MTRHFSVPTELIAHVPADPHRDGVRPSSPASARPPESGPAGHPAGTCDSSDERRLVDFVVWELRTRDLPADVREAAFRLGRTATRPVGLRVGYTEGPLHVDGFPRADDEPLDRRRCFPHQAGRVIRDLLDRGCRYVLVQDL